MSLVQLLRPTTARLAGLAGMLALPLLAGCVYDDGYYNQPPNYGYDYGNNYGYGYGGGYGYGYGYYGNPCWPYGCDDGYHHHHHHGDDNDNGDDNNHHHHHGAGVGMNDGPQFDPGAKSHGQSHHMEQPNASNEQPRQPAIIRRGPTTPYWIPQGQPKDSHN
jgi:hypothetical protein